MEKSKSFLHNEHFILCSTGINSMKIHVPGKLCFNKQQYLFNVKY